MTNLLASDWDYTDQFGIAVDISGNYAIIGAYYEGEDASGENTLIQAGSAYVFSYCSTIENNPNTSICLGDSIFLGGKYQAASGFYYDTLRASTGCDSVIVTDLTVIEVDTAVTLSGTTLTAAQTNASYQWIDCGTNQFIPGETAKNFFPSASGDFTVEVTYEGCIDTSFCHTVTIVGIPENTYGLEFKVYPIPTRSLLLINTGKIYEELEIRILNLAGKQILNRHYAHQQHIELSLAELSPGLYFIQLEAPDKYAILKVLKDN